MSCQPLTDPFGSDIDTQWLLKPIKVIRINEFMRVKIRIKYQIGIEDK